MGRAAPIWAGEKDEVGQAESTRAPGRHHPPTHRQLPQDRGAINDPCPRFFNPGHKLTLTVGPSSYHSMRRHGPARQQACTQAFVPWPALGPRGAPETP